MAPSLDAQELVVRARQYFAEQKLEESEQDLSVALEMEPWNGDTWCLRAAVRLASGDVTGASADASQAIGRGSALHTGFCIRAAARYAQEDWAGAIDDCTLAIAEDPLSVGAWATRGRAKGAMGDVNGAFDDCSQALKLDPSDGGAWRVRGAAKLALNDLDGAVADLSEAISLNPMDRRAYAIRSEVLRMLERLDEAEADAREASRLPDDTLSGPHHDIAAWEGEYDSDDEGDAVIEIEEGKRFFERQSIASSSEVDFRRRPHGTRSRL